MSLGMSGSEHSLYSRQKLLPIFNEDDPVTQGQEILTRKGDEYIQWRPK